MPLPVEPSPAPDTLLSPRHFPFKRSLSQEFALLALDLALVAKLQDFSSMLPMSSTIASIRLACG